MKITGVILAGGQGKRMGGVDKGTIQFRGSRLADRVFQQLHPQVNNTVISGPNDYGLSIPNIIDPVDSYEGPLMGIYAALLWNSQQNTPADAVVTAPIDCPYTPENLVTLLLNGQQTPPFHPTYLVEKGLRQPTFALWPKECLPALKQTIFKDNIRAMKLWIDKTEAKAISYTGPHPLINLNKPEDLIEK